MSEPAPPAEKLVLCPYCGGAQHGGDRCKSCGGLFEPLSRRATQIAMGPWYIRDKASPFRPGCSYDILKRMAEAGKIKPTTVMRGPTTKQFWSVARNVPGIAHLVGYCHACGAHTAPSEPKCPMCATSFAEPRKRNELGLAYKTDAEAQRAQELLDMELRGEVPPEVKPPAVTPVVAGQTPGTSPGPPPTTRSDLLSEVLDLSGDMTSPAPAPTAPGAAGTSINFGPAQTPPAGQPAFDIAPTGPVPGGGGGLSPVIWVLLGLNLLVALAVVAFVLLNR